MTDRERDRSLQACSKGHDNLKSARYGTREGERAAGRCLSQGFPPRAASFVFPLPLVGPPTSWAGLAARIGLAAAFRFSAKFVCMGNRPNRLTAIQTPNRLGQFFRTWPFFDRPAYPIPRPHAHTQRAYPAARPGRGPLLVLSFLPLRLRRPGAPSFSLYVPPFSPLPSGPAFVSARRSFLVLRKKKDAKRK